MTHREIKSRLRGRISEATRRVLDRDPRMVNFRFYFENGLFNLRGLSRWIRDRVIRELMEMNPGLRKYKPEEIGNVVQESAILRGVYSYVEITEEDNRTHRIEDILRQHVSVNYKGEHCRIEVEDGKYISSPELLGVLFDAGVNVLNISTEPGKGYIIDVEGKDFSSVGKALDIYLQYLHEPV